MIEELHERNRIFFFWIWWESSIRDLEWGRWPTNEFRHMWE
jgi:hypothetical protein